MKLSFNVFHVGGTEGAWGPASTLKSLGYCLRVYSADGLRPFGPLSRMCISNFNGRAPFYINQDPGASSLRLIDPRARRYIRQDGLVWEKACSPQRVEEVDVRTLDSLVADGLVLPLDFISMNAQGSELDILQGAEQVLKAGVVGVVSEVEFRPLYEGQGCFRDIHTFLRQRGFSLEGLTDEEWWFTKGKVSGAPYPLKTLSRLVAIATYLRTADAFLETCSRENLARALMAAACLGSLSATHHIWGKVRRDAGWASWVAQADCPYLEEACRHLEGEDAA